MLDTLVRYLREPLVVLSGTPVTTLTLLVAILIVVIARILASVFSRSVERVLATRGLDKGLRHSVGKITHYVVLSIGVFVALDTMGVDTSAIMAGGAVLLVGIGFGLQKLAENFISGLLLLIERPVRVGDFIDVGGVLGVVDDIGLRATRVISRDGVTVIVPNANLISGTVLNHSVPTTAQRIWVNVSVAYGTDLDAVVKLLEQIAGAEQMVQQTPVPEVRHLGFGDSAINLALVCWIYLGRDDLIAMSKLRFAIDREFRKAGFVIPVPQREVHMVGKPAA